MIEKLKEFKGIMDKQYFMDEKVVGVASLGNGRVQITFENGVTEEMTMFEWEQGASDKPAEKAVDRNTSFVKRTTEMRREAVKALMDRNPRYWDVPALIARLGEGVKEAYEACIAIKFGTKSFEGETTIEQVFDKLVELGKNPTEKFTDFEKDLLELVKKHKMLVWEVRHKTAFSEFVQKATEQIDEVVSLVLGVDNKHLRVDDIEKILQEYAKNNPQSEQGGDQQVKQDGDQPQGEVSTSVDPQTQEGKPEEPLASGV